MIFHDKRSEAPQLYAGKSRTRLKADGLKPELEYRVNSSSTAVLPRQSNRMPSVRMVCSAARDLSLWFAGTGGLDVPGDCPLRFAQGDSGSVAPSCSLTRLRSTSTRNCPHAASMSSPRLLRTVASTP